MTDFEISPDEIRQLSPLVKAHIGDAYFHLYVRTRLLGVPKNVRKLHDLSAKIVSAQFQAAAYKKIEPDLTDEEKNIFRRGRNSESHAPRKSSVAEYHASTGFENLLGELFLKKDFARLNEICEKAFKSVENEFAR